MRGDRRFAGLGLFVLVLLASSCATPGSTVTIDNKIGRDVTVEVTAGGGLARRLVPKPSGLFVYVGGSRPGDLALRIFEHPSCREIDHLVAFPEGRHIVLALHDWTGEVEITTAATDHLDEDSMPEQLAPTTDACSSPPN